MVSHLGTVVRNLMIGYKKALISCAETLQYETATLPARQMNQDVLPEVFSKRQQEQSKLDGGLEIDGKTKRDPVDVTEPELKGHESKEAARASMLREQPRHTYSEVSLKGCHQSLLPAYRLPSTVGSIEPLDPYGMVRRSAEQPVNSSAEQLLSELKWEMSDNGAEVVSSKLSYEQLLADAQKWSLSFVRDFRALHQFNHDHNCNSTCIKYIKKEIENAKQALQRGRSVACRFYFFIILTFIVTLDGVQTVKRIRRKGKQIIKSPRIATTNRHNELGRVEVIRERPFRSPSGDTAQSFARSNVDLQFMPRVIEVTDQEMEGPEIDPCIAKVMFGVRFHEHCSQLQRRMFHSIVAMFQAAHNCDYYITKYQAKAMEQLQNLFGNIYSGLRRLEKEVADTESTVE